MTAAKWLLHPSQCPHCDGERQVDAGDRYEPGFGPVADRRDCPACDAGRDLVPLDAYGVCACDACTEMPYRQRMGSDRLTDATLTEAAAADAAAPATEES